MISDIIENREQLKNNLESVQKIQIALLQQFDSFCKQNSLNYWIDAGTLLGAVRNGKFIPWDDDIDVVMDRQSYIKLLNISDSFKPDQIHFQNKTKDPKFKFYWSKIRDRKSTAVEEYEKNDRGEYHQGISLDIFPFDFTNNPKLYSITKRIFIKDFKSKIWRTSAAIFRAILIGLFSKKEIIHKAVNNYSKNTDGKYLVKGFDCNFHGIFEKEMIFPLKTIQFEGYSFPCPNKTHEYLIKFYGENYLSPPPENKRNGHLKSFDIHKACIFETIHKTTT